MTPTNPQSSPDLSAAAKALYYAGHWRCDRSVDEVRLWTDLKNALGLPDGTSPSPSRTPENGWATLAYSPTTDVYTVMQHGTAGGVLKDFLKSADEAVAWCKANGWTLLTPSTPVPAAPATAPGGEALNDAHGLPILTALHAEFANKILAIARQQEDPDDKSAIGEAIALELHEFQSRLAAPPSEDKARLDWLEREVFCVEIKPAIGFPTWKWWVGVRVRPVEGHPVNGLREAIDAARATPHEDRG